MQLLLAHGASLNVSHLYSLNDSNINCLPLMLNDLKFEQLPYTEKRKILSSLIQCDSTPTDVIASLLTYNVGLNIPDEKGETFLHKVILNGNKTRSLIPLLISSGARLIKNKEGKTPKDIAKKIWGKNDLGFFLLKRLEKETSNGPKYVFSD